MMMRRGAVLHWLKIAALGAFLGAAMYALCRFIQAVLLGELHSAAQLGERFSNVTW